MSLFSSLFNLFSRTPKKPKTPVISTPTIQTIPKPILIEIVNSCSVLKDEEIAPVVAALQIQVSRDFAPAYGIDADIHFVGKGKASSGHAWQLFILDNSDEQDALGYHDLTPGGKPIGKSFAKTDIDNGANWTITLSHELLEMLADPWANLTIFNQTSRTAGRLLAMEVCDACEADKYGYQINGIWVSDFVYPAWFGIPGSISKLDHMDHLKHPGELLDGGYIGIFDVTNGKGWTQITAQKSEHAHRESGHKRAGSRRHRRFNRKPKN